MAKDYAGKRSSGRSRGKTRRGKQAQKKPFPITLALFVIAMVGLGGYGLMTIKGASDAKAPDAPESQQQQQPSSKPKKEPKPLPEAPDKTSWGYQKALPDKTVEVEVEQQQSQGPYQLQCGSFRTQSQADSMKATIAFQGLESQVRRTTGKNGVWYRVVLGPLDTKRHGEAARHKLQKAGINTCQMWKWTD